MREDARLGTPNAPGKLMDPFTVKQTGNRFSSRTNWDTEETAWMRALTERRSAGLPVYDLTEANPTRCGFDLDPGLLRALTQVDSLTYSPVAFGLAGARQAVCDYYSDHLAHLPSSIGKQTPANVNPGQVILTASTSEAYSFLFRLLCDPGDEVMIAQPGYPLFDYLAVLDDVKLVSFSMFYDHGWHLDLDAMKAAITSRTRAIMIVHPNTPTGHFMSAEDRKLLEDMCLRFGLALIVDEVFLDYSLNEVRPSFVTGEQPVLTFVLSGLSKVAGLPQMKLAWLVGLGPERERNAALARLEVIADTFLSVNTPVQYALPAWLGTRQLIQQRIRERVKENLRVLDTLLKPAPAVDRLQVEGGWYAIVRAPALESGEEAALQLLLSCGVAVHPGKFFGIAGERSFVISLLPGNEVFAEGAERLIHFLDREQVWPG